MNPYSKAKQYKATDVTHLTPCEQVARLLELAAKHIFIAKDHAKKKEYLERLEQTEKATIILHGLQNCLDDSPEAESISKVLHDYYNTMTVLITKINIKNDADLCDAVAQSLRSMAETWREIDDKVRQENLAAHKSATPENFFPNLSA